MNWGSDFLDQNTGVRGKGEGKFVALFGNRSIVRLVQPIESILGILSEIDGDLLGGQCVIVGIVGDDRTDLSVLVNAAKRVDLGNFGLATHLSLTGEIISVPDLNAPVIIQ